MTLGAGASGAETDFATEGTFPPFTTRAGVAGSSSGAAFSTSAFSLTADFAGADETLADFAALADGFELAVFVGASLSAFDELPDVPLVMSGVETGEAFAVSPADERLSDFDVVEEGAGAEVATD
jgi:hypothetical protein